MTAYASQMLNMASAAMPQQLPWHVAMLTSYVPPHQLANYEAYADNFRQFTVLVSTPMERHRSWQVDWGRLHVEVQRTWTKSTKWRHQAGFTDKVDVHLPLDTISRLRALNPDVVISGELGLRSLSSAFYSRWGHATPLILWACVSEHTEQGRGWMRSVLRRWLLNRADAVIVNGASGRRYIRRFGVQDERIYEIPYSAVPRLYDQCSLEREPSDAVRLLYVGQLIERKGLGPFLEQLLRWAKRRPDRQVEFTIAGEGPLRESLAQFAVPPNLGLHFVGRKSHAELVDIYSQSDILVFPTLADEWGLVVNEALASGLPVLGSLYSGAVEELCVDGETGWIFRPDQPQELESALDRALQLGPANLKDLRAACRQRVANINPTANAQRLKQVVMETMQRFAREHNHGQ